MTTLNKRFMKKLITTRDKCRSRNTTEQQKLKEEDAKREEDKAQRLVE